MSLRAELRLRDFDISDKMGFIPTVPPLQSLPDPFSRWEDLLRNLHSMIEEGRLREEVHNLPAVEFSENTLKSEAEWWRAYVVLTFLSQAYMWGEGERGLPDRIPQILAVPWCKVAEHVGIPPVMTYAAGVLYNWGLRDPSDPGRLDGDNLYALATFTGTEDESWFYMVTILVEQEAVVGLKGIEQAFISMRDHHARTLVQNLEDVRRALEQMKMTTKRMYERCKPKTFSAKIRPFFSGSKGIDAMPEGMMYEGVDPRPKQYRGASAAQNSAIHAFDIFLGAKHTGSDSEFLQAMREYMPYKHGKFLQVLSEQPSLREYVCRSGDADLVKSYNNAVDALGSFRSEHVIMVTRYVVAQKNDTVNTSLEDKGTGGTNFMLFLKKVRDDTLALKI